MKLPNNATHNNYKQTQKVVTKKGDKIVGGGL